MNRERDLMSQIWTLVVYNVLKMHNHLDIKVTWLDKIESWPCIHISVPNCDRIRKHIVWCLNSFIWSYFGIISYKCTVKIHIGNHWVFFIECHLVSGLIYFYIFIYRKFIGAIYIYYIYCHRLCDSLWPL